MLRKSRWFAALLGLAACSASLHSAAQAPDSTAAIEPPRLSEGVRPVAPHSSSNSSPPRVLLELIILEDGSVGGVEAVQSSDATLEPLALEAARQLKFTPARDAGTPVRVKIRYLLEFAPAAVAPEAAAAEAGTRPVAGERSSHGPGQSTAVSSPNSPSAAAPSNAAPMTNANATAKDELPEFEATASVEAPPSEVVRRTVDETTIQRAPGTRGDALRAIELMPGVARTSLDSGAPLIRGANFNESATLLNGTRVPFLYHFGGLTSFLSSRMVSRIDFYPGNFSVRYGRIAGGVVEVRPRDPDASKLRAALDLNLIDSSAFVEAPLGERTHVAAAVRRSNIDFVFENFVPKDAYSVVAAPVYFDYQLFGVHRFDSHTKLRVLGYGSRDTLELLFSNPTDFDPALAGSIRGKIEFHRLGLELEAQPSQAVQSHFSLTVGQLGIEQYIGDLRQVLRGPELYARAETRLELDPRLRLTLGGDLASTIVTGEYRGPYPGQFEGDPSGQDALNGQRTITAKLPATTLIKPAGYVELAYRPVPELFLIPGVRVDYLGESKSLQVDPRFALRWEVTPKTAIKAGVGRFSQELEFWQRLREVGNPKLEPYRTIQASAGFEQRLGARAQLGAEAFYKRIQNGVSATPGHALPHFQNTGTGNIYGAELSAQARTPSNAFLYLAYTLSRSERRDRPGAPMRLFDRDQTHILSLVASQPLGKGWELGARFRYVTGNPTTPVKGSVFDARSGSYLPIYGDTNSDRTPAFHQLDVRLEKLWHAGPVKLAAYLDVLNVYNAQHPEGTRYNFDYSKSESVTGMPIFPNLGLRGEL
ncbi:MAG TPA: TonB-dependent receptor [Polyangiaceae bacterium]|nr:TonB-dependent receptor [Polyangiaceae bacterium]